MKKKLAIVITHPIQYYAPVFQLLHQRSIVNLKVFYTWGKASIEAKYDPGFNKIIKWDLPLLDGYDYTFLENTSGKPGSSHFMGIINSDIVSVLQEFNPDAILVYGWSYHSHLKVLRYFKNKTLILFRGDSHILNSQSWYKTVLRKAFLNWIYKHVDLALYVGTANKNYYLEFGLKAQQLIFAPHATDNERFSADHQSEASTIRKKLKLNSCDILLLFAGKLEPVKNPELLCEAFKRLQIKNVHLLFVGNGILEEKLKLKIKNENIERVHFMDFQNQKAMPVIYQACDIYCLPSKSETWGLAINEAMAAGKVVLASNKVGCAEDLITENDNGFIFESDNVEDLKNKLELLCNEDLQQKGRRSAARIKEWCFLNQVISIEKTVNAL